MRISTWVKTADSAALPFTRMPAYTAIPMFLCLVHMRWWTFFLALGCTLVALYAGKKGFTLFWLYLRAQGKMHGNRVSARPIWHIRRFSFLSDPIK